MGLHSHDGYPRRHWPVEMSDILALLDAKWIASMDQSPEQLHKAFQDAFNKHDLESIVALYEPGAVLVSLEGTVRGADAIRDRYRDVLAIHPTIKVQTLSVNLAGDLAMLHGKWVLHGTGQDGCQIRREGRNTETVRQQTDGRWLFVIDNPRVPQD